MAVSLKEQIETTIEQAIFDLCGVDGSNVDGDLDPRQQLKSTRSGYGILSQDYKRGPLVSVELVGDGLDQYFTGNGSDGYSMLVRPQVVVSGISQYSSDIMQTIRDRDLLKEVIQLNLMKLKLAGMRTSYAAGGKREYAATLNYQGNQYLTEIVPGEQSAPRISSPVANSGNTSTGVITVDTTTAYIASIQNTYIVEVVTGNTSPGNFTGLTWRWKKGFSGTFSNPTSASGSYQALSDGVNIRFTLASGQSFVAGDSWTIQADPTGLQFVAKFDQVWNLLIEVRSGF
jgi:hypothetical protein